MLKLDENVKNACEKYTGLNLSKTESGYVLTGTVVMNAEYNDIPLYDEYFLKIVIPAAFPDKIPLVRDLSGKVPKSMGHFYDSGELCLGANCEILDYIQAYPTVTNFIDTFVMSFLYAASYFDRYGCLPYGERSHGIKGIEEAYMERYECSDRRVLMQLLLYLTGIKLYRGHLPCVCGSGKKLRNCHGVKVLSDLQSELVNNYRNDAFLILTNYIREGKNR